MTQPTPQPMSQPVSQTMKILVALNVVTLVAVVLLGLFIAVNVADASKQVSSIAAAVPESGIASAADVQDATAATQAVGQAVDDLTSQVTALQADLIAVKSQVAELAAAATSPSPGPTASPDGTLANIMSKLQSLQDVVTHLQEDLAAVNGLVQTVCKALGRC
jgi:peptidoglycan hydrolase CwlO-like protein